MEARKIWSLAWVLAVLAAGLYGLGKLSLLFYGSGTQASQTTSAQYEVNTPQNGHHYRRAIVINTIPPQPALRKKATHTKKSLPDIFRRITVRLYPTKGERSLAKRGIYLVVSNASDFEVEQTQVLVEYLSAKGAILFTDTVPIEKLRAHSKLLVRVPTARLAEKVRLSVLNIYLPDSSPAEKYL